MFKSHTIFLSILINSLVILVQCAPASQPLYHSQYAHPQNLQQTPKSQPQYVIQYDRTKGLQQHANERVSHKAQFGGPLYLEQIQAAQQQAEVVQENYPSNYAQRKVQQQQYRQQPVAQQQYVAQQQPQQHRFVYQKPAAEGFKSKHAGPTHHRAQEAEEELEEDYDPNPSYQFGFDVKDDLYTNYQNRKETKDGNKITGSYSVVDSDGFIRTVTYTADPKEGFKAEVTRTPTDIVVKIPKRDSPQFERHRPEQQFSQVAPRKQQYQQQQQQQQNHQYQQHKHQQHQHRPAEKENVVYQYQ